MQIINQTTNAVLAKDAVLARSFVAKNIGLLTYKHPTAMILNTRWGIHTFGMRYPIDVVILDSNNNVVKIKTALKPNRIFLWNPQYKTVLELPAGIIKRTQTKTNNYILFK